MKYLIRMSKVALFTLGIVIGEILASAKPIWHPHGWVNVVLSIVPFFLLISFWFFVRRKIGWTYTSTTNLYRRWYLMCRNELEKIDANNHVLEEIGPRTSKKEAWENAD